MTDNIGNSVDPVKGFNVTGLSGTATYDFSSKGISWPSDAKRYAVTNYDLKQIVPPRDWIGKTYRGAVLADGKSWDDQGAMLNPLEDEHFQVSVDLF
jgi:hypothetical protein